MKKGLKRLTSALAAFAITAMCLPCMPAVTVEAAASTAVYTNLLAANHDPGFENGAVNTTYWNISGDATQSKEKANSGTYSAKVTTAETWRGPQAKLHGLVEGQEYYLSAWVYTEQVGLKAQFQLCGETTVRTDHYPLTAGDWTQISVVVTAPAVGDGTVADGHRLFVNTNVDRTSPIYFDDFEVVPISVEGNMVQDFGFESGTINSSYYHNSGTVAASKEQSHSGIYSAKSSTNQTYSGPRAVVSGLEVGAKYYVSAWAHTSDSGLKAKIGMFDANNANSAYALPDDLVQGEWTRINSIIDAKYETAKFFVNIHSGTRTQPMYFDDFVVVPVSSSVENGDTDVIPNADITLTIPEDVQVNTSTLTIDGGAKVYSVKTDGRTHVVSFTGMESNTKYNLKLNDGKTINTTWTFTTGDYTNILESQGYDPDFEGDAIDTAKWIINKDCTSTLVTEKAFSGNQSIYVTNRNGDYRGAQAQGVVLGNGNYYISGWVYPVTSGTKARVRIQEQDGTCNDLVSKTVKANEWNHLSGIVTCSDITKPVYFYIQTEGSKNNVYMDNLEIISLTPPAAEVYSPLNGAERVSVNTDLKLVFTKEVEGVDNKITINNDATIGTATTADNKNFTVDLGNLQVNKTYTATVSGVVDKNGNTVANTTFTFTTASDAGYNNLLADYDPGFEAGEPDSAMWKYNDNSGKVSIARTNAKAHTGDYSVLRKGADAGYRGIYATPALDENTNYYASLWVYSEAADTAQLRIQYADTENIPSKKPLPAGEWTQFSAVIDTTGAQDLSQARFYINTTGKGDIYVDDFELLKIGKILKGKNGLKLDSMINTIDVTKLRTESYSSMRDMANDIEGSADYDITITDTDKNGKWSDGDVIKLVSKSVPSEDYTYTYTVNVIDYYEGEAQAVIVKGSDGLGDDFSRVDTITKAGNAFIEYRVLNNSGESITPAVVMASYDENGRLLELDVIDDKTITDGAYNDYEFNTTVLSGVDGAIIKIMVWDSLTSMKPLTTAEVYTIKTNDFTVPNVISDNMVLQRNTNAVVFGKAPEGATVTAALSGGITSSYTVPAGDNEFFVELPMGDYSNTEQTLTITAEKQEKSLGIITRSGILVGDVYYGGGQSNMARKFSHTAGEIESGLSSIVPASQHATFVSNYKALGETLKSKNVRFFNTMSEGTQESRDSWNQTSLSAKEVWKKVDADNISETYETMIRMVGDIYELTSANGDVPIGIVACAQGGTEIAKWVSRDALLNSGNFPQKAIEEYEANITKETDTRYWASHTDLYYDGVRSVMPYTVKAAVWYQGESDSDKANASDYDKYLKAMIADMRVGMKNENLPYLIVQLPGYDAGNWSDKWPVIRLLQWNAQQLDNVYTVVTNDSGDNGNIHPANKDIVGERLARTMLAKVLGEDVAYIGPTFKSVTYGAGTATVTVDTYGGTLAKYATTTGSPAFQLTTDGGNTWTNADSITVSGDVITVKSSSITGTVNGVRYAYAEGKLKCIYADFDDVELPLAPFDTTFNFTSLK